MNEFLTLKQQFLLELMSSEGGMNERRKQGRREEERKEQGRKEGMEGRKGGRNE